MDVATFALMAVTDVAVAIFEYIEVWYNRQRCPRPWPMPPRPSTKPLPRSEQSPTIDLSTKPDQAHHEGRINARSVHKVASNRRASSARARRKGRNAARRSANSSQVWP